MENGILIKNRSRAAYVLFDDIYYVMKDLRKTLVYTKDDEFWEYGGIERICRSADPRFYRCHKSLMVNLDKLLSVEGDHAVMTDGRTLHMCRTYLLKMKKKWLSYRGE